MVVIKDTVRAEETKAIVLIEETTKMFMLRSKEYKPKPYKTLIKLLISSLSGTKG